ncbi:exported hypothetical protein [Gammaproteobacteria bacterium]
MLNIGRVIAFIATSFLATISLATTCAPGDANCQLDQQKLQSMNEMGITPVKTKDQSMPETSKKISKPQPFQIPVPKSSQADMDQDAPNKPAQVQYNPGLKITTPADQNLQEQEATPKTQPVFKQPGIQPLLLLPQPQTQTGIYH